MADVPGCAFSNCVGICPDAFRGSSTLVWASQICDISTGDVADAVAVCCNPGCSEGT